MYLLFVLQRTCHSRSVVGRLRLSRITRARHRRSLRFLARNQQADHFLLENARASSTFPCSLLSWLRLLHFVATAVRFSTQCMHNSDRDQLASGLHPNSADHGNELYRQRRLKRSHHLMNSQDQDGFASLSSPRGEQQQLLCKYKSGKCSNPRATKRNGQLHTLCHFHRDRQNEHQRKSDRKHRMVSVARRAKIGSIGVGSDNARRHSLHSITSLEAAFPNGYAVSPLSRLACDQNASDAYRNSQYPAGLALLAPMPPTGTTRLPPISFLMPGKLDGYRASSTTVPHLPPNSFISETLKGNAGKTA